MVYKITSEEEKYLSQALRFDCELSLLQNRFPNTEEEFISASAWNKVLTNAHLSYEISDRIKKLLFPDVRSSIDKNHYSRYTCWDAVEYVLNRNQLSDHTLTKENKSVIQSMRSLPTMEGISHLFAESKNISPGNVVCFHNGIFLRHVGIALDSEYLFHKPGVLKPEIRSLSLVQQFYKTHISFWKKKEMINRE